MLHAWVWLENPDGPFHSDNWALPFARLGLTPPAKPVSAAAARALSLLAGGDAYHETVLTQIGGADATDSLAIHAAIARARERAGAALAQRPGPAVPPTTLTALAGVWEEMWDELDRALPVPVRDRLRAVRGR